MSVHAVRIVAAPSPTPDLVSDLRDEHGRHAEALPEQAQEAMEVPEDPRGRRPAHVRANYRYRESEHLGTLLDDLEAAIPPGTPWFAIYYHSCDHDLPADMRGGCSWESTPRRARGSVPMEVRP